MNLDGTVIDVIFEVDGDNFELHIVNLHPDVPMKVVILRSH